MKGICGKDSFARLIPTRKIAKLCLSAIFLLPRSILEREFKVSKQQREKLNINYICPNNVRKKHSKTNESKAT